MIEIEALGWVVSIDPTAVLAPGMFLALVAALISGFPVAFCLGGIGVIFALLGMLSGEIEPQFVTALPQRILGIMANFTLLAIPAFVFMGAMLESSGIAERLLDTMGRLLGRLRGGLALAVVLVGSLLAATTGVVAATVTTMGLISLPAMLRAGYDKSLATGVIVASGTLGQIIPPSIVLVVLGDQLGICVGDLFIGALIPGLLMAAVFAAYVLVIAALKPHLAPQLPAETNGMRSTLQMLQSVLPPLSLIVAVLGSIFLGIATPHRSRRDRRRRRHAARRPERWIQPSATLRCVRKHHAHHGHGDGDPDGLNRLQPCVPRRRRRSADLGASAQPPRGTGGLSGVQHADHLSSGLLHRFL